MYLIYTSGAEVIANFWSTVLSFDQDKRHWAYLKNIIIIKLDLLNYNYFSRVLKSKFITFHYIKKTFLTFL